MSGQARLLSNLHRMIRDDVYIKELCKSIGIEIDSVELLLQDIYKQYFFDTMTWGADLLAKQMDISFGSTMTQAEKNSLIKARWINSGKSDIGLLQAVVDSWKNGDTAITFEDGTIKIKFINDFGVPSDLDSLKSEIDKAKPCHLLVQYIFNYLLIRDINNFMTIDELETQTLDKFAF